MYLNKDKAKLRNVLGTHLKSNGYTSYEDAMYDVVSYLDEKKTNTLTSSSIHYALKFKVDSIYVDEFMKWASSNSYFNVSESGKKITYTLIKSPFK